MSSVMQEKILHLLEDRDRGHAVFRHEEDDAYDAMACTVRVSPQDWADLGHPDTITVTLEPGDRLNPADETR